MKLRGLNSIWVSHLGGMDPMTRIITWCFPGTALAESRIRTWIQILRKRMQILLDCLSNAIPKFSHYIIYIKMSRKSCGYWKCRFKTLVKDLQSQTLGWDLKICILDRLSKWLREVGSSREGKTGFEQGSKLTLLYFRASSKEVNLEDGMKDIEKAT